MKGENYMNTENKNVELDNQMNLFEDEVAEPEKQPETNDELKDAIETTLSKIRRQSMLLGAQVMLQAVLDKITAFERKPGSKSNNDHKRLIKEIKQFVETGLSRKVNTDGETEPIEKTETETAQN
jgi:hypothetical protein